LEGVKPLSTSLIPKVKFWLIEWRFDTYKRAGWVDWTPARIGKSGKGIEGESSA
jgi:hypothetical protein